MAGPFGGIWSETPPVQGVPTPSGSNMNPSFQQYMQALQKVMQAVQQEQAKAGVASKGIPGQVAQAPAPPFGTLPVGAPGTPTAAQAAGGGPTAAPRQAVPAGVPGTAGSGTPFAPGVTYRAGETQSPYYTGGQTGKGAAANAIVALSNILADKRRANDEKQYMQAEGLWTQILNAQQNIRDAAAQGLDDPDDKRFIQDILNDKQKAKMLEDTLGVISTVPGGEDPKQQQDQNTPQAKGARAALDKFARKVGGALDPRTAAQRMSAGQAGPGLNQPGGVRWSFPAPTPEQRIAAVTRRDLAMEENKLLRDPANLELMAKRELKLAPTAAEEARIQQAKSNAEKAEAHWKVIEEHNRAMEEQYRRRTDAYVSHMQAAGATASPDLVKSYSEKVRTGEIKISAVPTKDHLRDQVMENLQGVPIHVKLDPATAWSKQQLDKASDIAKELTGTIQKMIERDPKLATDSGLSGFYHAATAEAAWYKYQQLNMRPDDPDRRILIKDAAILQQMGAAPFIRIGRGRYMYEAITQHLPKPNDTPAQMLDKVQWLQTDVYPTMRQDIYNMEWSGQVPPSSYGGKVPAPVEGPGEPPQTQTVDPNLMQDMGQYEVNAPQ